MNREDWLALAQASMQEDAEQEDAAQVATAPREDLLAADGTSPPTHLSGATLSATVVNNTAYMASPSDAARVAALHEYRLLDAPADDELSAVVRAAAMVAGVPHATLNLIDEHRQCQLTTVGFEGGDSAREDSMCALHFEDGELVHVVDASLDPRFARNRWVDGRMAAVRFYASTPLLSPAGYALGSLCVFDTVPGQLSEQQASVLRDLANVLIALFERRRQARHAAEQGEQAAEARELAVLAMAEAEERWELSEVVAETIDVGLIVIDAEGHVSSLNQTARQWHGVNPSLTSQVTLGTLQDRNISASSDAVTKGSPYFAPDGTTALGAEELPWLRALREGVVNEVEIILAPAGLPRRTLVCSGRSMQRTDGTVLGAVVALNDVTHTREREHALAQAHAALAEHTQRVQALADASRALALAEDPQEVVCRSLRELTGADAAYLLRPDTEDGVIGLRGVATSGLTDTDVFYPDQESSLAGTCFTSSQPVFVADVVSDPRTSQRIVASSGVVSGIWHPVVLSGQRTVGVLGVFWRTPLVQLPPHMSPVLQTLSGELAHAVERADLVQRLAQAAERDALTGLANRRRWDEAITGEVARAARSGVALSVALIDLDHFKNYNDTHGHLGGDALLREFAAAAGGCLREVDTLARWGGEEFVVALPGCTATDAAVVADRIRTVVPRGQSCTIGVAQWQPGLLAEDVIAQADQALYRGKEAGRDATVIHAAAVHATPAPSAVVATPR